MDRAGHYRAVGSSLMDEPELKPHISRRHPQSARDIPLLTPDQEAELEKDLVPVHRWGPARILPRHRRRE